jgi:hypothetical protein
VTETAGVPCMDCGVEGLMKHRINFWGNSSDSKKIVRLMMYVKSHNYCRGLFKRLEILTLPCEYIFSLMNFITNNEEHFQTNADGHC